MAFFNHTSNYVQIKRLSTKYDQFQLFKKIYQMYDKAFILESLFGPKELSENSIIGFDPEYTISCDSKKFAISDRKEKIQEFEVTNPLQQLRRLVPRVTDNRFRYLGGAVGYISYDAIRFLEDLPVKERRKNRFPLLEFGIYLDGLLFNHLENQAYYFCMGRKSRLDEIEKKLRKASTGRDRFSYSTPKNNLTRSEFTKMVNSAKKYIYDGDIFQVVLSRSLNFEVKGDPIAVYSHLREINPSPYMYMLRMGDHVIIGSSPEMLLRITNDYVETFPIAGTRPALKDKAQNEKLRMELINDKKEIAEHTMLVDLARNDIGRVCKYGTVKVNDFMTVKQFSHVQHIVSHVTGRLDESYDSFDAIKAVFPAGTVSGAPKVRAMEIIDELEPNQRGPYGGALGYFSANGSADFAITIRSLFILKNSAYIQAGAGIVIDSVPQKEWLETEQKANALLSAIKYSKLTRN